MMAQNRHTVYILALYSRVGWYLELEQKYPWILMYTLKSLYFWNLRKTRSLG
jgi:hypothetical protein